MFTRRLLFALFLLRQLLCVGWLTDSVAAFFHELHGSVSGVITEISFETILYISGKEHGRFLRLDVQRTLLKKLVKVNLSVEEHGCETEI